MSRPEFPAFMFAASARNPRHQRVRRLISFAISVLAIAAPASAQECGNTTGTEVFDSSTGTVTCSGNQSSGVSATARNVIVKTLTSNITPASGLAGIRLEGSSSGTLNSTLGAFKIITQGFDAHGIDAEREQGVTIIHSGEISSMGDGSNGIRARTTQGEISIDASGNIAAGAAGAGIFANTRDEAIAINHVGNITAGEQSSGIYTAIDQDGGGEISITSRGNINLTGAPEASLLDPAAGIAAFGYGNITINSTGDITTTGEARHGIFATTETGNVSINSSGNIDASGDGAAGIWIVGGLHNTVNILAGTVSTTLASNVPIVFEGAPDGTNTLNNYGTITRHLQNSAVAAIGSSTTVINNHGVITGGISLFGPSSPLASVNGPSAFNNFRGATFNAGTIVDLGVGGTFRNFGTFEPLGQNFAEPINLGHHFFQAPSGVVITELDMANNKHDFINVVGTAQLAGRVAPRILSFGGGGLHRSFIILSAAEGVTNNGLTVLDTALIDYSLLYPNATDVVLAMHVSFNAPGLTPNQSSVLDYFGRGAAGGGTELQSVFLALLNAPDTATIAAITDQLYSNAAGGAASSALQFGDALAAGLRSCPVAEGPYGELRETSCIWAKPTYRQFSQDKGGDRAKIDDDTSGISGGFQAALGENIWGGLGFSLEESNTLIDGTTRVDGTWWQVGGAAKWAQGPWKLSGSLSGGQGDLETVRSINIPGLSAVASSDADTGFATGLARLAYSFGADGVYVTPMLNAGFTYINIDGFTESGAGALNLQVASASETIFSGGPAIEIGATIIAEGLTFRPYAKFGVTFLSEDTFTTQARFASAPLAIAPFTTQTGFDEVYADVSAGVQWFSTSGINLRLNYDGRFGDSSEQHGIDAKLTVNY